MVRLLCLLLALMTETALGQQQDPVQFPSRSSTEGDLQLVSGPNYVAIRQELDRIGLHRALGQTCTAFVTTDSIRSVETTLPLDGTTVTLPVASFLIWDANRAVDDAVLYHVFAAGSEPNSQPQKLPAGTTKGGRAFNIVLAPRAPYPSATDVRRQHDMLAEGPFTNLGDRGGGQALAVKPYVLPTEKDDPASALPRKAERTLQLTGLVDPKRVTNCLCAGTQ